MSQNKDLILKWILYDFKCEQLMKSKSVKITLAQKFSKFFLLHYKITLGKKPPISNHPQSVPTPIYF